MPFQPPCLNSESFSTSPLSSFLLPHRGPTKNFLDLLHTSQELRGRRLGLPQVLPCLNTTHHYDFTAAVPHWHWAFTDNLALTGDWIIGVLVDQQGESWIGLHSRNLGRSGHSKFRKEPPSPCFLTPEEGLL